MRVLITGVAGFIGSHVANELLRRQFEVLGFDNLNGYYDPKLKLARLAILQNQPGFRFQKVDISDHRSVVEAGTNFSPKRIIHLGAQAGVRYSIKQPFAYAQSNLVGHLSVLELARTINVDHLVYASSSSVYGANKSAPFSESDRVDHPVSLYGATKKANEVLSESYSSLYGIPQTGLRFFTVYGPWGRPDMAYWIFTDKILSGEPIQIFNQGKMGRDFTFIDDIVAGIIAATEHPPCKEDGFHQIFNLGNDRPEELMTLVELLEKELGRKAIKDFIGMQQGDVERTWANIDKAKNALGYSPKIGLAEGIAKTVSWRLSSQFPLA